MLWDHQIPHEYRLAHRADHLGKSVEPRLRDGFRFLTAHVLTPPPADTSTPSARPPSTRCAVGRGVPDNEPLPPFVSTTEPQP